MKENDIYGKYGHFQAHVELQILPRNAEWSLKERLEKKLPTHNQNTTNYVEQAGAELCQAHAHFNCKFVGCPLLRLSSCEVVCL